MVVAYILNCILKASFRLYQSALHTITNTALIQCPSVLIALMHCNAALVVQATRTALTSEEGVQAARLSKKLVTIHTDVQLPPLTFPFSQLSLQSPSDTTRAAVKAAFAALEFRQHEKRLDSIWENMMHNQAVSDDGQGMKWGAANA